MNNSLFLHIGYPKTGATALQRNIFPWLREYGFFYAGYNEQQNRDAAAEFCERVHADQRQEQPALRLDRNALISCEGVIADCLKYFDAGGRFRPRPVDGLAERVMNAAQSYEAGDVRVIIVLRRQGELSHSMYAQSYTHYFSKIPGLRSYPEYVQRLMQGGSIAAAYDYATVIADFLGTFGRDRVLVLFYEDLVNDQQEFLAQLSDFTGCSLPDTLPFENVRLVDDKSRSTQTASIFDVLSALKKRLAPHTRLGIGKYLQFLHRVPARKAILIAREPELERQVQESCRDSNIRLAGVLGRDLSALEYY